MYADKVVEVTVDENICSKDPCQNIAKAIVGSCQMSGQNDFVCACQRAFSWNDDVNMCMSITGMSRLINKSNILCLNHQKAGFNVNSYYMLVKFIILFINLSHA